MRLLTDAEKTCDILIEAVKHEESSTPKIWWKFAIKASYIKVT